MIRWRSSGSAYRLRTRGPAESSGTLISGIVRPVAGAPQLNTYTERLARHHFERGRALPRSSIRIPQVSRFRLDSYIDHGSIEQFSAQILEAVENAHAVLLRAPGGGVLWASGRVDDWLWPAKAPSSIPSPARHSEVGPGRHAYDFRLRANDREHLDLSVLVKRLEPVAPAKIFDAIQPILECLERQLALNASLSSRFKLRERDRAGLELIAKVGEFEPLDTLASSLDALADLCREYLSCEVVAIVLPKQKLQIVSPRSAPRDRDLVSLLTGLLARAKSERRILISRQALPSRHEARLNVLSCPIPDPSGRIIGLLVALGSSFTKEQARVARSAGNRINLLIQQFGSGRPEFVSRDRFIELVDRSLQRLPGACHSVLYFDADKTHLVNDSFGYEAGDKLINTIATLIKENAGHGNVISHLMGDRFALFLRDADSEAARSRAEHLIALLGRESIERGDKTLQLSASMGIATAPSVGKTGAELLSGAEIAARGAKERGGNQCAVFESLDASMIQRRSDADRVGHLQMALIEDRFVLYAQEIRSLDPSRNAKQFEILVRLCDEDGSLVLPHGFLSAAERYQLMPALDRWVINHTLAELARTTNTLEVSLATFCINVSPQSLREPNFVEHIENVIADSGVPPDSLCFEFTESALVRNFDQAQRFTNRLQKRGCRIALDDFGTGYSSFAYLKHLPVNCIKVDGAFVRDLLDSALSRAIVSSVVQVADVMGAATVGEHVENELVSRKLRSLGVNFAQGFHIHEPEPLADVLAELDTPDPELAECFADVSEPS